MKKILILVPHPDDEIVGTSIIIKNMLERGCSISLFFLSNGVIDSNEMWFWKRKRHTEYVEKRINEMKKSINFLNIKNFYLQDIPTRYLKLNIPETYSKIKGLVKSIKIDTIFAPAYEGGHQDHDIANFIASKFKDELNVYEFSEYNYNNHSVKSNSFIKNFGEEKTIVLSKGEVKFKRDAMKIYESEENNLNYIEIKQECYRPLIDYDYLSPPHKGILFYRRFSFFSWHPKVDSTHPSEVCRIINEYR